MVVTANPSCGLHMASNDIYMCKRRARPQTFGINEIRIIREGVPENALGYAQMWAWQIHS